MTSRFRRNAIVALKSGDTLIDDVEGNKSLAFDHFKERFKDTFLRRLRLEEGVLKELSLEESSSLEVSFSLQDIKEVIWSSLCGKSLGPNNCILGFFKARCVIIKKYIFDCVN